MKSNVYFIADRYRQAFYEVKLPPYARCSVLALEHVFFRRPFFFSAQNLAVHFCWRKCEKQNINKINEKHTQFYAINIAILLLLFHSWQINLQIISGWRKFYFKFWNAVPFAAIALIVQLFWLERVVRRIELYYTYELSSLAVGF